MVLSASSIVSIDRRRQLAVRDLPQPGRVRGGRRGRARRRLAAVGGGLEAPGPADPRRRRSCCSCSCSSPLGIDVNGNQNWLRIGPVRCSRPRSSRSGWCSPAALILAAQAQAPALPAATCWCPTSCRSPRSASALVRARPRPRHRAHPRRDRRRGALRRRASRCAGSPSPACPFAAMAIAFVVTSPNRLGRFDVWLGRDTDEFGAAPPADPRPLRPGRRRLVRPRARGEPREVGPALRAAQRLHLRDHRRGARAARHPRDPAALRRPGAGLLPPGHAHRRPLRADRDGRHHDLDPRPGAHQHRRRHRPAPRHRRAAAAGVVRRVLAHHDACSPSASCCPSRAPNPAAPRRCPRDPRPLRRSLAVIPGVAALAPDAAHDRRRVPGRCSSRGAARPATSRRCSPSPTACAGATPRSSVTALGTAAGLEARLVPERGLPAARGAQGAVAAPPLRRPAPPARQPARAPCGAAEDAIDSTGAEVVVGFGGYVSTPAYLAARRRGTPIVVHEQNARPGLANRLGARFAAGVGVTFPGTPLPHATVTGMPLRREIATLDRAARRAEARARVRARPTRPTLLVTGGSLGAQRLNDAFAAAVAALSAAGRPGAARRGHRQGRSSPDGVTGRARTSCSSTATGWTSPTPPPTSSSPAPAPTRCASSPPSGCPRSTCRCRSATASSGSTPRPWSRPAAACSSTTPTSPPAWVGDVVRPARPRRGPAGRRWPRPPRRWASAAATSCWPTSSSRPREVAGA